MVVLVLEWLPPVLPGGKRVNDVDLLEAGSRVKSPLGSRKRRCADRAGRRLDMFGRISAAIAERLGVCPGAQLLSHAWLWAGA
ncbi:hypothetical protein [Bradyrhizobium sp. USDA 4538]|uniref:hypothetical protein n=1 Tax=Bradyrhizobium sp. USDA 4538 TaxID=2817702 RepID=UPI0020A3A5A4|nr:hypothetical protein [Bradyrhizobium sp. USDA 4538]MCP1993312.1 hypothetical protein [Bradyrhizobium sp. USDA 4539]